MVFKKSFCLLFVLVLCSIFIHSVFAQQPSEQFVQFIEWENVDYAMHYEIVLEKNILGEWTVYDTYEVTTNALELTLGSGDYRYNVTVYNVFGRAEQTTEWYYVTIERALQPIVNDIFPKELELKTEGEENENVVIALTPQDVADDAIFFLQNSEGDVILPGNFIGYDENGMMQIEFETETLDTGDYELIIQDPSGLTSENLSTESLLSVDRYSPTYTNISLGYSYAVFPPFENTLFSDYNFPSKNITLRAKVSYVPFVSSTAGSFGFELSASVLNNNFISTYRDVTGFIFPVTINAVYHKPLGENFVLATHLGVGVSFLNGFMEWNASTAIPNAAGIAANGGIAGQYFFNDSFFVELGADYMYSYFLDSNSFHTVLPTLSVGWSLGNKAKPKSKDTAITPEVVDLIIQTEASEYATIYIRSQNIPEQATIVLVNSDGIRVTYGSVIGYDENGMIQIEFNTKHLANGHYTIFVEQGGGLTEENNLEIGILRVRHQLDLYLNLSAGYTYALIPPIENTLFDHVIFPSKNISGRAKLSYATLVSPTIGAFGVEVSSFVLYNIFSTGNLDFRGFLVPVTINALYHKPIGEKFVLAAHIGAGLNFLLNFNENTTENSMQDAAAIAFTGGLAGQYFVNDNFFVELGIDYIYSHIIDNTSFHTVLPILSVGWKVD